MAIMFVPPTASTFTKEIFFDTGIKMALLMKDVRVWDSGYCLEYRKL